MAIVKKQKIGNATFYTDDSAYSGLTPEQIERRRKGIEESFRRAAVKAAINRQNQKEGAV